MRSCFGSFAIAAVATVAPFGCIALIAQLLGQLCFEHRFDGIRKQAGENALLTKEVIDGLSFAQLLLHLFERQESVVVESCACAFFVVFIGCLSFLFISYLLYENFTLLEAIQLHTLFYTLWCGVCGGIVQDDKPKGIGGHVE